MSDVEEATTATGPATVADELAAMRKVVGALEALDRGTRDRVLTWLVDRYDPVTGED